MRYHLPPYAPFLLLGTLRVMLPVNYTPWDYGPHYDWMVTFGYAAWVLAWLAAPVYVLNRGVAVMGKQGEERRFAVQEFWAWLLAWIAFVILYHGFDGSIWFED